MSKFITVLSLAICLTGCYTSTDLAEFTKEKLKEKYGEEFVVFNTMADGKSATAYPVSNPDLLFRTEYWIGSSEGRDSYIQEIVCAQYKEIAEEKLKDFNYEYYIDVDMEFVFEPVNANQDVTIEEYLKANPEERGLIFNIYISTDILEISDKDIYQLLNLMIDLPNHENAAVNMYFIENSYIKEVKENYRAFSYPEASFYDDMIKNKRYDFIRQKKENYKYNLSLNDIINEMEKIRDHELYR